MKVFLALVAVCALVSGSSAVIAFQGVPPDIYNNIFIYLMQGTQVTYDVRIPLADGLSIKDHSFFDPTKQTNFYFHGWNESVYSTSVSTIASAFLDRGLENVAVFDYSVLVRGDITIDYAGAFLNATNIGKAIGQFFKEFTASVQDKSLLHLVSHSLGSQVMANTAREYGAGLLPWLTGLDPAGPFFNMPLVEHLDKTDGVFVDVIHTDNYLYGDERTIGTVDFFPNKGTRIQPYCEKNATDFCSHHMSWRFYAAAIRAPTLFKAKRCRRFLCDTILALCSCTAERNYIGPNVTKDTSGEFFLTTSSQPPFGQGETGLQFGWDRD